MGSRPVAIIWMIIGVLVITSGCGSSTKENAQAGNQSSDISSSAPRTANPSLGDQDPYYRDTREDHEAKAKWCNEHADKAPEFKVSDIATVRGNFWICERGAGPNGISFLSGVSQQRKYLLEAYAVDGSTPSACHPFTPDPSSTVPTYEKYLIYKDKIWRIRQGLICGL